MASYDDFGNASNVLQLTGVSAVGLVALIVKASSAARMHKQNCRQFAQHVKLIGNLLEQLKISEMKKYPETSEPLEQLEDALRRAYLLVNSCKERSFLYLMAMGWSIVQQFKLAQDEIDRYLKIIPLIALLDNSRVKERLAEIEKDKRVYILDEDDQKIQEAISQNNTIVLKKSISCSYPKLSVDKALRKEREKLQAELRHSQSNMDFSHCQVIERLIQVTDCAASTVEEKEPPPKSYAKSESVKEQFSSVTSNREYQSTTGSRDAAWPSEWHTDLLGCCSEPSLCIKTFFCPCATLSKIASVATGEEMSSSDACNEMMAYSLILSCCCYTCCIRRKLRSLFSIKGNAFDDCLSHFMCCCCALVQEWREVEIRDGTTGFKSGALGGYDQLCIYKERNRFFSSLAHQLDQV